jgi:hypothetical protein
MTAATIAATPTAVNTLVATDRSPQYEARDDDRPEFVRRGAGGGEVRGTELIVVLPREGNGMAARSARAPPRSATRERCGCLAEGTLGQKRIRFVRYPGVSAASTNMRRLLPREVDKPLSPAALRR